MTSANPGTAETQTPRRRRRIIRRVLLIVGILAAAVIARPVWFLWSVSQSDISDRPALPTGMIDDASTLNATDFLTAGSGAIWHDILAYLDPLGRSVQVMPSNDSFTVVSAACVGGTVPSSLSAGGCILSAQAEIRPG